MYEILLLWFIVSLIWWVTIGTIGIMDLENLVKKNYPEFISIWGCLAIGYYKSKDKCNILGRICITLLIAILYLPILPLYSLLTLIGFVLYKLITWKPKNL